MMTMPVILRRILAASEADEVLARLQRRMPHVFAGASRETRVSDLPLDSLDVVELLCATEDEFGVRLTSGHYQNAHTVGDLTQSIARRWARSKGASQ
jgi:acyl carrier protein